MIALLIISNLLTLVLLLIREEENQRLKRDIKFVCELREYYEKAYLKLKKEEL